MTTALWLTSALLWGSVLRQWWRQRHGREESTVLSAARDVESPARQIRLPEEESAFLDTLAPASEVPAPLPGEDLEVAQRRTLQYAMFAAALAAAVLANFVAC